MRHNDHGATHLSTKIDRLHDRLDNEYEVFSAGSVKKWSKFGLKATRGASIFRSDFFSPTRARATKKTQHEYQEKLSTNIRGLGVRAGGAMYKDPPLAESLPFAQHPLPVLVDPPMCQRQSSPAAKLGSTSASVQLLVRRLARVPRADNVVPALRR
jgi:hypothetical protein